MPRPQPAYTDRERRGSVGRWLLAVAVLAVLTVAVTVGINMLNTEPRQVQVPDVRGQASADAIAQLQNSGFRIRTQQRPDSTVPPDHVINTEPGAATSVEAGKEVTLNVSTGPEQREVPDVRNLSYPQATQRLTEAGFERFRQSTSPSAPELKDKVIGTNPPANQTSAITNEITIVVGTGPDSRPVPDVTGQTEAPASQILNAAGFTNVVPVQVDSAKSCGQVVGTLPPPDRRRPSTRPSRSSCRAATSSSCPTCGACSDRRRTPAAGAGLDRFPRQRAPTCRTAGSAPTRW